MATVLITGTNKGVGLEMTKIYAARVDTVIACCRNPDDAELPLHKAGAGTRRKCDQSPLPRLGANAR